MFLSLHDTGDTILSVNQHAVNMDNVDSVLATLSNKVHFLIKKGHSRLSSRSSSSLLSPPPPPSPLMSSSGGLVRLVTGGKGGMAGLGPRKQQGHFHLLLYITLDTKEDDPPEKVLFACEVVDNLSANFVGRIELPLIRDWTQSVLVRG